MQILQNSSLSLVSIIFDVIACFFCLLFPYFFVLSESLYAISTSAHTKNSVNLSRFIEFLRSSTTFIYQLYAKAHAGGASASLLLDR